MDPNLRRQSDEVPPGYWEALMDLLRKAPKLPEREDTSDFPDPLI